MKKLLIITCAAVATFAAQMASADAVLGIIEVYE